MAADKDALICDLAETYGVFDFRALPVPLLATLASGLRDDSRIKMRMANAKASQDTFLLAAAVDALNLLVWSKTKDASKGRNRPKSIVQAISEEKVTTDDVVKFRSANDFNAAWARLSGGG
ncbi:MAG: DUF5361 domain-containing protein [Oscillospiraceae bacterium]|nr:DUF5361 domain-containing protein [Oscillospiraceae bacterium]